MANDKDFKVKNDLNVGGDITVVGTVDGRDVATDGTKLDTIETNAKDDQSITAGSGLTGGGTGDVTLNVGAGTGITVNANDIAIAQPVDSDADVTFATLTTTGDIIVGGDLQVSGTTTTIDTQELHVTDNMIYMADGYADSAGAPTASVDIGFAAGVNDNGSYEHVGFFRDATDDRFKVFKGYTPEPDAAVEINTGHASFSLADMQAATFYGALSGNASTASQLQTTRTIALSGDVTGSTTFNGSENATISTTIAANSVALGTDTTGNYVATITGTTNEVEVSGSGSENAGVTIGLPNDVTIGNDLSVTNNISMSGGNFYFDGTTTYLRSDTPFYFLTDAGGAQVGSFKGLQVSTSYSGTPPNNGILFGTDTTLYRSAANTLSTGTGDSFSIQSGQLAVGTTTFSGVINAHRTTNGSNLVLSNPTSTSYAQIHFDTNSGDAFIWHNGSGYTGYGGANSLNIYNSAGNAIAFHPGNQANTMYMSSGGNVGINTTSPSEKLHIKSGGNAYKMLILEAESGAGDAGILLQGAGGNQFNIQQPGSSAGLFFYDRTNAAYRMYIDATGNVLVGKSASAANTQGVEVRSDGRLWVTTTSDDNIFNRKSTDGSILSFRKDNTELGTISISGGNTQYGSANAVSIRPNSGTSATGNIIWGQGNIKPWNANYFDLGDSTYKWKSLYLGSTAYINHNADNAGVKLSFQSLHASNNTIEIHQFGQSHANAPAVNQIGVSNAEQHLHFVTDDSATVDAGTSTKGIFLRSGGNVGIGTTSPSARLDVYDTGTWDTAHFSSNTATGAGLTLDATNTGVKWSLIAQGTSGGANDNNLGFHLTSAGTSGSSTGYKFTMTHNSRFGIGTTSPSTELHVVGQSLITNTAYFGNTTLSRWAETSGSGGVNIKPGTGSHVSISSNAGEGYSNLYLNRIDVTSDVTSNDNRFIDFYYDGVSGVRVRGNSSKDLSFDMHGGGDFLIPNGNVGIGTTSPAEKLHVEGSALIDAANAGSERGIFFREGFSASNKYNVSILTYDHNGSFPDGLSINAYDGISFCTGSNNRNERMRLTLGGDVGIGTTSPASKLQVYGRLSGGQSNYNHITRDSLVVYVDFNNPACHDGSTATGTLTDLGPNNYSLTYYGTGTTAAFNGQRVYSNGGAGGRITVNNAALGSGGARTWEAWVYCKETSGWNTIWDSNGERPLIGYLGSALRVYPNSNDYYIMTANTWNHIVVAFASNSDFDVFVNGTRVAEAQNYSSSQRTGTGDIWLGGDAGTESLNGYISIARVYTKQLTAEEVLSHYNAEVGRHVNTTPALGIQQRGGNVGIGRAANGNYSLTVDGSINAGLVVIGDAANNNNNTIEFVNAVSSTTYTNGHINYYSGSNLSLVRGGGNVSIGVSSIHSSNPKLYVEQGNRSAEPYCGIYVKNPNTSGAAYTGIAIDAVAQSHVRFLVSGSLKWQWRTGTTTGGELRAYSWDANTDVLKMSTSGNVTASGNLTAYSDISLKDNIEVIPHALDKVKEIRGVTYNRNDIKDNPRHTGVIAQEVEKVLPEVVTESSDGIKNVAYGNMVGLLIEAIKEQQETIDKLQARVEALENN